MNTTITKTIIPILVSAVAGYISYKNWDAISETVGSAVQAMREAAGVKTDISGTLDKIAKAKQAVADAKDVRSEIFATEALDKLTESQINHEKNVAFWRGLGHEAAYPLRKLWIWALILFSIGGLWIRKRMRAGDRMA